MSDKMTDLEITALCADAMGWRSFKEKRGEYEQCVSIAESERDPWMSYRDHEKQKERYTPCTNLEALKIGFFGRTLPKPLTNDEQAMALVKRFGLNIAYHYGKLVVRVSDGLTVTTPYQDNLNRAICECVAKMQANRSDK